MQIDNGADSTARGHKARSWAAVPIWQCHKVAKPGRGSLRRRIREVSCRSLKRVQRTFEIGWVERVLPGWHHLEAVVVRRANIYFDDNVESVDRRQSCHNNPKLRAANLDIIPIMPTFGAM